MGRQRGRNRSGVAKHPRCRAFDVVATPDDDDDFELEQIVLGTDDKQLFGTILPPMRGR